MTIEHQRCLDRQDRRQMFRDLSVQDRAKKMSESIQRRITKNAKSTVHENLIFAKYCPRAPFNTTQYLMEDYQLRMDKLSTAQLINQIMMYETALSIEDTNLE